MNNNPSFASGNQTFLLFAGSRFYAKGGIRDFIISGTIKFLDEHLSQSTYGWWQIVDKETLEIVEESESQAHY